MLKNRWVKNSLFFLSLAFICFGVYATVKLGAAGGTIIIATGFGIMIMTQFEWSEIKLLGLEARLRDTISDAEKVLDSLKKVSIPISEVAISLASRTGRLDTATSNKDLFTLVTKISSELKQIGVSDRQLSEIKKDWFYFTTLDMCRIFSEKIKSILNSHYDEERKKYNQWVGGKPISDHETNQKLINKFQCAAGEINILNELLWKKPYEQMPTLLKNFVHESKVITEAEKELLWAQNEELWKDINYFVENTELRRPDFWFSQPK